MKKLLLKIGVSFGLSLFFTWVYLFTPHAFFSLDHKLRDYMFVIRGALPKSDNVVIVDIDNKSLKSVGQWPWSRDIISSLITNLSVAEAGIIGFDMVFAEKDSSSPHLLQQKFPQIKQKLPNYDLLLANTLSHSPVVGGFIFTEDHTLEKRTPLIPAVFIEKGLHNNAFLHETQGIVLNIPIIQQSLYTSGFFMLKENEGGVIRSVPLLQKYQGIIYPSLAFEMLRVYSNSKKVEIIGDTQGIQRIHFAGYTIPTDSTGEFIINFRGPKKHFTYISAIDILNQTFKPEDIKNKFILIGTSAPGLKDLRYIAYDSTFPGVEVHANVIDNILTGDYLKRPLVTKLYDIGIIWVLVFVLMLIFTYITSWLIIPIAVSLFFLMLYGFYNLLFTYGFVVTLITPILTFFSTLILSIGMDYFFASKQREQAKSMLGKKVSPSVMRYLLDHSSEGLIESKEVEATIFFSDIRDFTTISENIGSPKKLIEMLNIYMTPMTNTIMKYQGTIDKFIGDAIMAYWNAPVPVVNHADKAVTSAVKQIQLLNKINKTIYAKYNVQISIGIGLHTGLVTAGDMGSEGRSDYTIIGDNVNLASRIEGLTRLYGVSILISEETYRALKNKYTTRPIDTVEVKGKVNAVKIHEVLINNQISKQEQDMYLQAYTYFQKGQVLDAIHLFQELQDIYPSKLYVHYIERCQTFINNQNIEFTAVLKMTKK